MKKRKADFASHLDILAARISAFEYKLRTEPNLQECEKIRSEINELGELANNVTDFLPEDPEWPELYSILRRF